MARPSAAGAEAFERRAWSDVCRALSSVSPDDLTGDDIERLAVAAYLVGDDDAAVSAWEAAHRRLADEGDHAAAARCSVFLAMSLMLRGQMAQAGGWLTRAEAAVAAAGGECAAAGYLLIPALLGVIDDDPAAARDLAERALEVAERFGDADLRALAVLGLGQAFIGMGDTVRGTAELDAVMVAVTAGEVGPIVSGLTYCAVVFECMRLFDLARAAEWTAALQAWCDAQPDLVPYRGQCLVHRAQLLQAAGDWREAASFAEAACRHLSDPPHPALGLAHYQEGELHRLRGALDDAGEAYRHAHRCGHPAMPGMALLDLARGDHQAAGAAIGRALQERGPEADRPELLAAAVEIHRASGDLGPARAAADELTTIATARGSEVLLAMAHHATGSVLLGEGDPVEALGSLRQAAAIWQRLHLPYESARTAVMLGLSCAALGDRSSAALELDTARAIFSELGARPDLERVRMLAGDAQGGDAQVGDAPGGVALSAREREVLRHVVSGKTNRDIAAALVISEHTVSRHLQNIFTKLGVSSRAAATAHAFEHGLL